MRNGQNKRMRGRNHHHRKNQNPLTRVYESNGPDVKIRGTASHIAEKYMQLARDATSSGDPVTAENNHQHAEHYLRLIAAAQEQFRQQNPYYRPEGEMRDDNSSDDAFTDSDDENQQPMQAGQPNFGNQQPYPPRESQPYGGQPHQQGRPQHQQHQQHYQPRQQQHHQPHQQHQQHQQPNQQQPPQQPPQQLPQQPGSNEGSIEGSDGERLPSFITGGQPQQNLDQNGYDNQGGDRYGMHRRRRRHRGHHRGDMPGGQSVSGDAPDNTRPDND